MSREVQLGELREIKGYMVGSARNTRSHKKSWKFEILIRHSKKLQRKRRKKKPRNIDSSSLDGLSFKMPTKKQGVESARDNEASLHLDDDAKKRKKRNG